MSNALLTLLRQAFQWIMSLTGLRGGAARVIWFSVAIGVLFLGVIAHHHEALQAGTDRQRTLQEVVASRQRATLSLHHQFLTLQNAGSAFVLTRTEPAAAGVQVAMDAVLAAADALAAVPAGAEDETVRIRQIREQLERYVGFMRRMVELWRARGLGHDNGLQGQFRRYAHQLEAAIHQVGEGVEPADALRLERDLLQLRRREKDYLLRGHEDEAGRLYVAQTLQGVSALDQQLTRVMQDGGDALREMLARYRKEFLSLVQIDASLDGIQQEMAALAVEIDRRTGDYAELADQQLREAIRGEMEQTRRSLFWLWGGALLAFAVGGLLVLVLVRSLRLEQDRLTERNGYIRTLVDSAVDGILTIDERGIIQSVNPSACRIFGYQQADLVGRNVSMLMPEPFRGAHDGYLARYVATRQNHVIGSIREVEGVGSNGERFPLELSVGAFEHRGRLLFTGILHDITERKKAKEALEDAYSVLERRVHERTRELHGLNEQLVEQLQRQKEAESSLRLAAQVFANASEAILITDTQGNVLDINASYERITGYQREDVVGRNPRFAKSGRHPDEYYREMWQTILRDGRWEGEIWDRRRNGEVYPKWLTINAVKDETGQTTHYIGIFSDISHIKAVEQRLEQLAYYDALTGLPNRMLFRDRLEHEFVVSGRKKAKVAVFFIDLDRFKIVNDTLGHAAGDALLVEVARRISACVRKSDTVARLGGDEFTVILTDVNEVGHVAQVAANIITSLTQPVRIKDQDAYIGASIGIAFYPDDGQDFVAVTKNADIAMYKAKESGRGNYQFFKEEMNERSSRRLSMEQRLRKAMERGEFFLLYQPKASLRTGTVTGMECLVRWRNEEGALVPPSDFIPVAEEIGLIVPLGEWILRAACTQGARWRDQGIGPFRLAVNLSAAQFQNGEIRDRVEVILRETGFPAAWLELEITESMVMGDVRQAIRIMGNLRDTGVHIAIDDFGTGYSSLGYLKNFPIQTLKIDQTFVRYLTTDSSDAAIVSAIISMAHRLKLEVVAEGVETVEQMAFLADEQCDQIQGYLLGRPVPAETMEQILVRRVWEIT
jgi:diguanylate cyclase (GGDEF)-like protein/PAS domain S-box-containing protein